jgi:hypothetical protein
MPAGIFFSSDVARLAFLDLPGCSVEIYVQD